MGARSSTTSTRPPTPCSPTCPGRPQEARQVQVRLEDPHEDPAPGPEGRGGGPDREEGDHPGPLRDPGQVHLEACLGRLPHAETSATPKLEVVAVTSSYSFNIHAGFTK